jgi:TonB family protein
MPPYESATLHCPNGQVIIRMLRGLLLKIFWQFVTLLRDNRRNSLNDMSPRSLLFSSNEETSRQLRQALIELEFHVEHCPEIFSAVEKLTSHTFDVIAVDWDEGAEASFLLKTARELKSNQNAVTVAVINDDASFPAAVFGVNVVLRKPVLSDEIKYSLLTCDEFLAGMRTWLAHGEATSVSHSAFSPEEIRQQADDRAPELPAADLSSPISNSEPSDDPSYDDVETGLFNQSGIQSLFHSTRKVRTARKPHDISRFVLVAAASVTFLAAGYAFSQPTGQNPVALALVKTYDRATRWIHKPDADDVEEANAGDEDSGDYNPEHSPRNGRITKIRITPARGGATAAANTAELITASAQTQSEPAQNQPSPLTQGLRVPESLTSPALQHGAEKADAEMSVPFRLSGMLQPVSLTQDLAEKLLLEKVVPSYPVQAVQARLQGPVVLQAWIGTDGAIRDLKLVHGSLLLGKAACDAVKRWRYKPYVLNGQAVEAQTFVTVDFRLPSEMEPIQR